MASVLAGCIRGVEARLALDAAKEGLTALKATERSAILSFLDDVHVLDSRTSPKLKMRRHRARQRLAELVARKA